ncbi:vanadium-dependent haloperoxidase [Psychroflexus sp. YR1-1]|uniref:Vanadium-dependent haloperoxidase n=1 Tax=Psychroflexus aurantiacus TaxID=2709310 RepID=A0A6B3QYV0_9FLAO|nr:vanadium-dependent haloperoxidase [Psychroflexus aurantiacus]NEV92908.1 vanadium-dependent haloperoxidase [Psychroflexus aurantiacus]
MRLKFLLIFLLVLCCLSSCQEEDKAIRIERQDYHEAIDKLTDIMVHDIFSPPVASRIYVYPNIAAYETLNQDSENYVSLAAQLNGLAPLKVNADKDKINLKLAALIAHFNVSKELVFSKDIMTSYRDSLYNVWEDLNPEEFETAKSYGLEISEQIITWMNKDGYSETRTMPEYNIYSEDPSVWQPTPPAYMKGIEPHWNKLRPFTLDSASQFKPARPPEFSMQPGSEFHKELMSVYNINKVIREKGNDSEEIAIARFWDCNPFVSVNKGHFMFAEKKITPGAHWIGICKIASEKIDADFSKTVYAQTKASIAIADAFISCWDEKYRSNLVRPETLINTYIDPDWLPILQTPPFPEYTSGHSVVSSASAEVLTSIFGKDFEFVDTTELPYGLPSRTFASFKSAAKEAIISRFYGGIHYESAIYEGEKQGLSVGKFVDDHLQFLKPDTLEESSKVTLK